MEWLRLTDDACSEGRAWDCSAGPGELRKWSVLGEAEGGTAFLPGAYVFAQRYRPPLGGPEPDL